MHTRTHTHTQHISNKLVKLFDAEIHMAGGNPTLWSANVALVCFLRRFPFQLFKQVELLFQLIILLLLLGVRSLRKNLLQGAFLLCFWLFILLDTYTSLCVHACMHVCLNEIFLISLSLSDWTFSFSDKLAHVEKRAVGIINKMKASVSTAFIK